MTRTLAWKLAVVAAVLAALGILLVGKDELLPLARHGLDTIRNAGPVVFFLCMALLPTVGVPLSVFTLTAAPLFGAQLGMPLVMMMCLAAITANMALGYVLAAHALRPLLHALLDRLGYRLPEVAPADATDLILLLRVTPGMPFPVQNYLLGLAGVPFRRYLALSLATALPVAAAFVFLGDALTQGRGKLALIGMLLLLAAVAGTRLVRRRYRTRQQAGLPPPG